MTTAYFLYYKKKYITVLNSDCRVYTRGGIVNYWMKLYSKKKILSDDVEILIVRERAKFTSTHKIDKITFDEILIDTF